MKNYYRQATESGVHIFSSSFNYLEKVQKDGDKLVLKRMHSLGTEIIPYTEKEHKKYIEEQQDQFDEMYRKVNSEVDSYLRWKTPLITLYSVNALLQLSLQKFVLSSIWAAGTALWYAQCYKPLRLRKELKEVKWALDNKEDVDRVIKSETELEFKPDDNNLNITSESMVVPYSQDILENGITLNNIDELTTKQLKKIRRKVKKANKRNA